MTTYSYNADTNVLEWVQYPENTNGDNDTVDTRTHYDYDTMYRMVQAEAKLDNTRTLSAEYTYTDDLLTSIQAGSEDENEATVYNFTYGDFALRQSVKIGTRTLATYSYTDRDNYLEALDYGNGDRVQYTYDDKGRVTTQTYEDGATVSYKYDNSGALATMTDSATGRTTTYYYDATDRLMKYVESGENYSHSVAYTYDNINNLTAQVETVNGVETTTGYTYDDDNRVTVVESGGTKKVYIYDNLGRVSTETVKQGTGTILTKTYTFEEPTSDTTSNRVSSVDTYFATSGGRTGYSYDDNGNIVSINDGGGSSLQSYVYDAQNQLVRENNYVGGYTHTWTYDTAGNILSRSEYAYTTGELGDPTKTVTYNYGNEEWKDLLTTYDGKTISYDQIGNPLSDGTWNYTWQHGRQLASMSDGTTTWTYTYDANGMRTSRTNGTDTYTYVYNGSQLVKMTKNSDVLTFTYDASGAPMTVTRNGTTYYYITNLQGDVERILDEYGTQVAWYLYDAWGELRSAVNMQGVDLAQLNPLRYRGYVYDTETQFYYLQSRYYNPEIGRFINADAQIATVGGETLGYNMFAYCFNNPVNSNDATGNWPKWATIALGVVVAAAAVAATVVTLGAAAPAAACGLTMVGMSIGASYAVAHTAATIAVAATVVAASAYAADVAYSSVTGYSPLKETVFRGNEKAYNTGLTLTSVATGGMLQMAAQNPGVCFVAGTQVLTACGYAAIEDIRVGDEVWAENPETGEKALKRVVQTFVNETNELVYVHVDGEVIVTTPEHPFYSSEKGWIKANLLQPGDTLITCNGKNVTVEKVQHETLETPITVYNFEVEDFHTYYVGVYSVLVHNECGKLQTNSQSKPVANKLGYTKVNNASSRGQAVYYNPKAPGSMRYISADIDSHNGGIWKAASSISNLSSKGTRTGTFNWDLSVRIGD